MTELIETAVIEAAVIEAAVTAKAPDVRASITSKPHVPLPNQREHLYSGWLWEYRVPPELAGVNRTVTGTAITQEIAMLRVQQILTERR